MVVAPILNHDHARTQLVETIIEEDTAVDNEDMEVVLEDDTLV